MAASFYPSPFEEEEAAAGEVKEGFLCPLCLKDLQSFYQLQEHYEDEHSGEERHHVRGQLKSRSRGFWVRVSLRPHDDKRHQKKRMADFFFFFPLEAAGD